MNDTITEPYKTRDTRFRRAYPIPARLLNSRCKEHRAVNEAIMRDAHARELATLQLQQPRRRRRIRY